MMIADFIRRADGNVWTDAVPVPTDASVLCVTDGLQWVGDCVVCVSHAKGVASAIYALHRC